MYCCNCGKEINDNVKFCKYCGANLIEEDIKPNASDNVEISKQNNAQFNTIFNRDVLNNYLFNIRTLEVYRDKLQKKFDNIEYTMNNLGIPAFRADAYGWNSRNYSASNISGMMDIIGVGVALIVVIMAIAGLAKWLFDWSMGLAIFISIAIFVITLGLIISGKVEENNEKKQHDAEVKLDDKRVSQELITKEALSKELPPINDEIKKTDDLLLEAYSVNIIPSKFRNIYAIYFIYDFIATSTASLNEALIHCDLDTIQQQLENVIQQQEEMIMELARSNAMNEQIIVQNNQMLNHAINTENNTALAAQYTKVAATNSSVVACIAMSEYLKP